MNPFMLFGFTASLLSFALLANATDAPKSHSGKPIRALLITGGCCHNYAFQAQMLMEAIGKEANATFTVVNEGGTGTRGEIELYKNPKWAKPYDVVIHNECFADTDSAEYVRRITAAHRAGTPAMVIHCAMHTYRASTFDDWREFLGVTSRRHDHQSHYPVTVVATNHPVMLGFPQQWVSPMDELYIIEKLWPTAKSLATAVSEQSHEAQPVVWINRYHGTRVFGTTFGHSDDTFRDPAFQHLLARGFLWAAGKSN